MRKNSGSSEEMPEQLGADPEVIHSAPTHPLTRRFQVRLIHCVLFTEVLAAENGMGPLPTGCRLVA